MQVHVRVTKLTKARYISSRKKCNVVSIDWLSSAYFHSNNILLLLLLCSFYVNVEASAATFTSTSSFEISNNANGPDFPLLQMSTWIHHCRCCCGCCVNGDIFNYTKAIFTDVVVVATIAQREQ